MAEVFIITKEDWDSQVKKLDKLINDMQILLSERRRWLGYKDFIRENKIGTATLQRLIDTGTVETLNWSKKTKRYRFKI